MFLLQGQFLLWCEVILLLICAMTNGSPTERVATYDQRQTGDLNIHINVKDFKIVALLGGGLGGSEVGTYFYLTVFYEMNAYYMLSVYLFVVRSLHILLPYLRLTVN